MSLWFASAFLLLAAPFVLWPLIGERVRERTGGREPAPDAEDELELDLAVGRLSPEETRGRKE